MQFVPLWTSILRSRKVASLPDDLYRTWTMCLLMAQEHDHKGGSLPPVDDLSYALHMEPKVTMSRLSRLVTLRHIDVRDGIYYIHDWADWKHRPDPTGAARKRAQRDRERSERESANGLASENGELDGADESTEVTVTSVTSQKSQCHAPTQLNSTQLQQHTPLPPVTGGEVGVGDDLEPFQAETPELPPIELPPEKRSVLVRQTQRFGASNGDRIIADLLRDYSAAIVQAACDHHYADTSGNLYPPKLTGICRAMQAGTWKLPGSPRLRVLTDEPTTNQPVNAFTDPPNLADFEAKAEQNRKELAAIQAKKDANAYTSRTM